MGFCVNCRDKLFVYIRKYRLAQLGKKEFHEQSVIIDSVGRFTISACPNSIKNIFCFKITDRESPDRFCRISMMEPEFIGAPDETLTLKRDELLTIIEWLDQGFRDPSDGLYKLVNWERIIETNNDIAYNNKCAKAIVHSPELPHYMFLLYEASDNEFEYGKLYKDEYTELSNIVGSTDKYMITTCPNRTEGMSYFMIYPRDLDNISFCRLSMTEASFVGAPDETLKIDKEDIIEIIDVVSKNWKRAIELNNIEYESEKIPNMYIDEDLIMPDYTKLLSR